MKALGYRVSPLEVETAIAQHPDVAEVACAEISPRDGVTVIGAFLVAKPGHTVDAASLQAFARERLAQYKCPREIIVVEALPRTPNGKVKRSELGKAYRPQD
jgi:acyl-coenzyme A synthetase/AMP-(fatty) acid ligase